ncbi:arsenate reductase (glutaredoxin) [Luteibaculum oceani]|uniref:Arsenate reductase (Glutaredoxin) n=1 Tax=Luteibaculum oceani TaxID=1294296 RepID=A0A5C6VAF0_9FLAO|nr:arsenate reductase (glutaredoxin) [Luteibaculum oceani]TXC81804.1 arsenate reductase (glutaredoxin) [Luteibaculum oceani]
MEKVIVYHNPRCSKSRAALAFLEEQNQEVEVIEYLKEQPRKSDFKKVLAKLDMPASDLVRKNEAYFKEKLKGLSLTEEEWIDTMLANPKLIERPIVIKNNKAVVARPADKILEIL